MNKLTYNNIPNTNLIVSEVGIGTYRMSSDDPAHRQSIAYALSQGINLIDTSSNYMDGRSEQCIGKVLFEQIESGVVTRDDVVIMTKGGYLQGLQLEFSNDLTRRGNELPEKVVFSEHLEHCIHPKALEIQLKQSLTYLGVDTIDVYLLHNPEYYLTWAYQQGVGIEDARLEFYRRIEQSFRFLEQAVKDQKISYFGVSSNTLGFAQDHPEFVSAQRLLNIAQSISSDHHFRVLQAPCNLIERNVATEKNNNNQSVVEFASANDLAFFANRPFNAIVDQHLVRLIDYDVEDGISWIEVDDAIQELLQLEMLVETLELERLELQGKDEPLIREIFNLGSELQSTWNKFKGIESWKETMYGYIYPRIEFAVAKLYETSLLTSDQEIWLKEYIETLNVVLKFITLFFKVEAANQIDNMKIKIRDINEDLILGKTFSQTGLCFLRSIPGVTSTLIGLRSESYVDDALAECSKPKISVDMDALKSTITEVTKAQ